MGKDPERVNWPMCYFPTQYLHLSLRGKEGKRNSETAFTSACLGESAWHAAGPPRGSDAGITGCQTAVVQREGLTSSHPQNSAWPAGGVWRNGELQAGL